ncbi:EF-hand domain-containing protein [Caenorhabditis elegans]|uniref:EF-hand domain-containing protein n=1 Tax=Caenorhabditis elegans TaxID=6239 RepID=Q22107_CAEEL|nr:EF-hand domain-containing protein [Caenorhabditis elegans]CCD69176.2 EF-hand domain-containing protein [Caenorhabditis elegans]|eukprot:NP_495462.2 Uncharacterized protein CELE_T02G5.3 [Caenorhabditis elegans]
MGDTKTQVNIKQAYTILNCSGRNVTSAHLLKQWEFLNEKIAVDRLYDIYIKAEEVVLEGHEYEKAVRTKTLKLDDILGSVKDGSLVNKQYLEIIINEFTRSDGYVDIGALLDTATQSKVDIVNKLLGPKVEEDEMFTVKVRGCMTVYPKVQCISYKIDVDKPTVCELTLCLAPNSDVPADRFSNDLFLVVYNNEQKLVGLTRHVLEERKYSTGMMTVNEGDEVMIVGMGTTTNRKRSTTERVPLIEETNKLSKRFKSTLMNIFDSFDVDQDGLLNKEEMNFYTLASGDSELTDQDWFVYLNSFDNRDGGLTMGGFIKVHEMEAFDPEGNAAADLWHSLHSLGYDTQLASNFGCSYDIEAHSNTPIKMIPRLQNVVKMHRAFILGNLYHLGEEDDRFEIRPHLFKTEYFGLLIARKEDKYAKETYRIQLSSREHLKINFPHQVDSLIRLADSDSEWVLVASYTVTDPEAQLVYTLEKVTKSSNPTSPSLLKA